MLQEKTLVLFLLPLRLVCGYLLLVAGFGKVESGWLTSPALLTRAEAFLQAGRTYGFFLPVLRHVMAHGQLYSILVAALEFASGAALLCGLFSRAAALGALLLCLGFLLAAGEGLASSPLLPLCAGLLTLSLCSSGRVLGLDAALRDRAPPWLS